MSTAGRSLVWGAGAHTRFGKKAHISDGTGFGSAALTALKKGILKSNLKVSPFSDNIFNPGTYHPPQLRTCLSPGRREFDPRLAVNYVKKAEDKGY